MRFNMKNLLFLFVVFSIAIHLIVHVVNAGPPDLTGPKIPRAELHGIYPEHGPVGHDIKITLSGKYFTQEYGVGVLRCKFKYLSNQSNIREVVALARRTTGGCIVTSNSLHYQTCTSSQATCIIPKVYLNERVAVSITNDYGIMNYTRADGKTVAFHDDGQGRFSTEEVYFTFVPKINEVEPSKLYFGDEQSTITVHGIGMKKLENRTLKCLFVNAGIDSLYLPSTNSFYSRHRPEIFQDAMKNSKEASDLPFYYELADTYIYNSSVVTCNISNNINSGKTSRTLIVTLVTDFCNFTDVASLNSYACNHMSPLNFEKNAVYVAPVITNVYPRQTPHADSLYLKIKGIGFPKFSYTYFSLFSTQHVTGSFETYALIANDDFEDENWNVPAMTFKSTPTLNSYNIFDGTSTSTNNWVKGPLSTDDSQYTLDFSVKTGNIDLSVSGFRGRAHNVSRTNSNGHGSLLIKKTSNVPLTESTNYRCDGVWKKLDRSVKADVIDFWVRVDSISGKAGLTTLGSGPSSSKSCYTVNETIIEFGGKDNTWIIRQDGDGTSSDTNTTYKVLEYVPARTANTWHHIIIRINWRDEKVAIAIDGRSPLGSYPFSCYPNCPTNTENDLTSLFLYNDEATIKCWWDDIVIKVGPSVPLRVDGNAHRSF